MATDRLLLPVHVEKHHRLAIAVHVVLPAVDEPAGRTSIGLQVEQLTDMPHRRAAAGLELRAVKALLVPRQRIHLLHRRDQELVGESLEIGVEKTVEDLRPRQGLSPHEALSPIAVIPHLDAVDDVATADGRSRHVAVEPCGRGLQERAEALDQDRRVVVGRPAAAEGRIVDKRMIGLLQLVIEVPGDGAPGAVRVPHDVRVAAQSPAAHPREAERDARTFAHAVREQRFQRLVEEVLALPAFKYIPAAAVVAERRPPLIGRLGEDLGYAPVDAARPIGPREEPQRAAVRHDRLRIEHRLQNRHDIATRLHGNSHPGHKHRQYKWQDRFLHVPTHLKFLFRRIKKRLEKRFPWENLPRQILSSLAITRNRCDRFSRIVECDPGVNETNTSRLGINDGITTRL